MDGREQLPAWNDAIWTAITKAVGDEMDRTTIARKFIPPYLVAADTQTVPADTITEATDQNGNGFSLTVDPKNTTTILEIAVPFSLRSEQVGRESDDATAVTLATRAANILAQAEDLILFQGAGALTHPLFAKGKVLVQTKPSDGGMLGTGPTRITVAPKAGGQSYAENTSTAVAKAYAQLQDLGHYGPYALILPTRAYADTYSSLPDTLIMPAERIKPLVTNVDPTTKTGHVYYYGTGTLHVTPAATGKSSDADDTGIFVSLGGNTLDMAIGVPPTVQVMPLGIDKLYHFQVYERFALRLKDPTAIILLDFEPLSSPS